MSDAVIVGGKLQGLEALYLAAKANCRTTLIDRNKNALGQIFCHRFIDTDVIDCRGLALAELRKAAIILPALEDNDALTYLSNLRDTYHLPLLFDPAAYAITSSKLASDQLFKRHHIAAPRYYPQGRPPYIAKPSAMSGSTLVERLATTEDAATFLAHHRGDWVVQEYIKGPSYSIEIIGTPGDYRTYHVTELLMDKDYDCKRVLSRPDLPRETREKMASLAIEIATLINLHGIMDLEVIDDGQDLRVLEIDARFPSQTPTVVYHATGINLFRELKRVYQKIPTATAHEERFVSLEHLLVDDQTIQVLGEHIMTTGRPLHQHDGFCGADEALTDYETGCKSWRATMILIADSAATLAAKREAMFDEIRALSHKPLTLIDKGPID